MTEPSVKVDTEYVVLVWTDEGTGIHHWDEMSKLYRARSADVAAKLAAEAALVGERKSALFVAVPARSWNPTRLGLKVETTIVVEEAKSDG